jgi:hypothetical protein
MTHFINCKINSSVGQNAYNIWHVASVEDFKPVRGVQLFDAVENSSIFTGFPQCKPGFQNLGAEFRETCTVYNLCSLNMNLNYILS